MTSLIREDEIMRWAGRLMESGWTLVKSIFGLGLEVRGAISWEQTMVSL